VYEASWLWQIYIKLSFLYGALFFPPWSLPYTASELSSDTINAARI